MWFKNRRAKFRKKQRSLQKEQLQKQKEAEGSHGEGKTEAPTPDTQLETAQPPSLPSRDPPAELHLSLSEQSASESAPEDQPDREEDPRAGSEDPQTAKSPGAESKGLGCKRSSPKAGEPGRVRGHPAQGERPGPAGQGPGCSSGAEAGDRGAEPVINTWHSARLHLKGLGQSRLVSRVHPLVAESWEGFGGPGRGVGWQRRGTWAAQGKNYLSTIMEIFWYFNNQYRHTSACGVNTMDTRGSHMQQRLGVLFLNRSLA